MLADTLVITNGAIIYEAHCLTDPDVKYALHCLQGGYTECPKSYRKSVLHLLKYTAHQYLSECSTDLR